MGKLESQNPMGSSSSLSVSRIPMIFPFSFCIRRFARSGRALTLPASCVTYLFVAFSVTNLMWLTHANADVALGFFFVFPFFRCFVFCSKLPCNWCRRSDNRRATERRQSGRAKIEREERSNGIAYTGAASCFKRSGDGLAIAAMHSTESQKTYRPVPRRNKGKSASANDGKQGKWKRKREDGERKRKME